MPMIVKNGTEEKTSKISMTPSIEIKPASTHHVRTQQKVQIYGLRLVFGHQAIYQHHQIRWPKCNKPKEKKKTPPRLIEKKRAGSPILWRSGWHFDNNTKKKKKRMKFRLLEWQRSEEPTYQHFKINDLWIHQLAEAYKLWYYHLSAYYPFPFISSIASIAFVHFFFFSFLISWHMYVCLPYIVG